MILFNLFLAFGIAFFAFQIGDYIASRINRKKRIERAINLAKTMIPNNFPEVNKEAFYKEFEEVLKSE